MFLSGNFGTGGGRQGMPNCKFRPPIAELGSLHPERVTQSWAVELGVRCFFCALKKNYPSR